jgi:hypothetical protein
MGTNKNRETSESGLKFIYLIPLYIDSSQKHKQQLLSKKNNSAAVQHFIVLFTGKFGRSMKTNLERQVTRKMTPSLIMFKSIYNN